MAKKITPDLLFLEDLLREHRKCLSDDALRSVLGDGFLLAENSIYRRVRKRFHLFGYRFTDKDFCFLNELPLFALPAILLQKKVPIFNNVAPLENLVKHAPKSFSWDLLFRMPFKKNFLLHESTHCLAHHILGTDLTPQTNGFAQETVLEVLAAEAYACTVEHLAGLEADTTLHRTFFDLNSYRPASHETHAATKNWREIFGEGPTFKMIFFGFLLKGFGVEHFTQKLIGRIEGIFNLPPLKPKHLSLAEALFEETRTNHRFLMGTTTDYFRFLGDKRHIFALTDFDPFSLLEQNSRLLESVVALELLTLRDKCPKQSKGQEARTPSE